MDDEAEHGYAPPAIASPRLTWGCLERRRLASATNPTESARRTLGRTTP